MSNAVQGFRLDHRMTATMNRVDHDDWRITHGKNYCDRGR